MTELNLLPEHLNTFLMQVGITGTQFACCILPQTSLSVYYRLTDEPKAIRQMEISKKKAEFLIGNRMAELSATLMPSEKLDIKNKGIPTHSIEDFIELTKEHRTLYVPQILHVATKITPEYLKENKHNHLLFAHLYSHLVYDSFDDANRVADNLNQRYLFGDENTADFDAPSLLEKLVEKYGDTPIAENDDTTVYNELMALAEQDRLYIVLVVTFLAKYENGLVPYFCAYAAYTEEMIETSEDDIKKGLTLANFLYNSVPLRDFCVKYYLSILEKGMEKAGESFAKKMVQRTKKGMVLQLSDKHD